MKALDRHSIRYVKLQLGEAWERVFHNSKNIDRGIGVFVQLHDPESMRMLTQYPKRCPSACRPLYIGRNGDVER